MGGLRMKASLGMVLLGTVALAATSVAQSAQTGAAGSVSSPTSATARRSGTQSQRKTSTSAATQGPGKTGKVASASPLKSGTIIQAELLKPLDAKKSKVGDEVIATITKDVMANGKVIVPSGSKLVGRIMGVRVQNSEQATSRIGIAFNRAVLKSGKEIPLASTIQAIGSNPEAAASAARESQGAYVGGLPSGTNNNRRAMLTSASHRTGPVVNAGANGSLSASSQGVVGLPGLSLSSQTTPFATAAVVSSRANNLRLDSGTEMILRVNQK